MMKMATGELIIYKEDDSPLFGNSATVIRVDDDGSQPYLKIEQNSDSNTGRILIDFDEIEILYEAMSKLKKEHSDDG